MSARRATLPQTARLRGGAQFTGAFEQRFSGRFFQVLARPNRGGGGARLGIVAGKRVSAKAVHRARARRIVREAFRSQRDRLGRFDIVVRLRADIGAIDRGTAAREIEQLLRRCVR